MNKEQIINRFSNLCDQFEVAYDFSKVKIPRRKKEFSQVVLVPEGLSIEKVMELCREKFEISNLLDLEVRDQKTYIGNYAIRLRDIQEAVYFGGESPKDLREKNIKGITLLQRLWLEFIYYNEKGEHLDLEHSTICSGSYLTDGRVPVVGWSKNNMLRMNHLSVATMNFKQSSKSFSTREIVVC